MTTWTEVQKYEGAPSTNYNDSSKTYDNEALNYNGQEITTWTEVTKN